MEETYSLYTYESGSLKIFGSRSSRARHKTINDCVKEYHEYLVRLKKVYNKDVFVDKQVLIVKYTNPYKSEIVAIIKNGELKEI